MQAFITAIRWARLNGYPDKVADITEEQNEKLQAVANEYDRRHSTSKK